MKSKNIFAAVFGFLFCGCTILPAVVKAVSDPKGPPARWAPPIFPAGAPGAFFSIEVSSPTAKTPKKIDAKTKRGYKEALQKGLSESLQIYARENLQYNLKEDDLDIPYFRKNLPVWLRIDPQLAGVLAARVLSFTLERSSEVIDEDEKARRWKGIRDGILSDSRISKKYAEFCIGFLLDELPSGKPGKKSFSARFAVEVEDLAKDGKLQGENGARNLLGRIGESAGIVDQMVGEDPVKLAVLQHRVWSNAGLAGGNPQVAEVIVPERGAIPDSVPVIEPWGAMKRWTTDELVRGPFVANFTDGGRDMAIQLATKNGEEVIRIYDVSFRNDIRFKELAIESGPAVKFTLHKRSYKYWVVHERDDSWIYIKGKDPTKRVKLSDLYKHRFEAMMVNPYAIRVEDKNGVLREYYISPQAGGTFDLLAWDSRMVERVWMGRAVDPDVVDDPRILTPAHVISFDDESGTSTEFGVKGKEYRFVFDKDRFGSGAWELRPYTETPEEPPPPPTGTGSGAQYCLSERDLYSGLKKSVGSEGSGWEGWAILTSRRTQDDDSYYLCTYGDKVMLFENTREPVKVYEEGEHIVVVNEKKDKSYTKHYVSKSTLENGKVNISAKAEVQYMEGCSAHAEYKDKDLFAEENPKIVMVYLRQCLNDFSFDSKNPRLPKVVGDFLKETQIFGRAVGNEGDRQRHINKLVEFIGKEIEKDKGIVEADVPHVTINPYKRDEPAYFVVGYDCLNGHNLNSSFHGQLWYDSDKNTLFEHTEDEEQVEKEKKEETKEKVEEEQVAEERKEEEGKK